MTNQSEVLVEDVVEISPHTKAVLAAGEATLVSSIETTRDFCKSMITISFSSVPVYLALLKIFSTENTTIPTIFGPWWVVPVALSLFSSCAAMIGYLPGKKLISLELPDELEHFIKKAANRRFYSGVIGFVLLVSSILVASWLLVTTNV